MKPHHLILAALCVQMTACTSADGTANKGLLGAATGGVIGALLGDGALSRNNSGNSGSGTGGAGGTGSRSGNDGDFLDEHSGLITGAAAGFAAGAITDAFAKNEVRQKYIEGYNKGRSDAIKELYWVKRDAERPPEESLVQRRYYEVPVPEHITTDGVLVAPHKRVIEVVE